MEKVAEAINEALHEMDATVPDKSKVVEILDKATRDWANFVLSNYSKKLLRCGLEVSIALREFSTEYLQCDEYDE